MEKSEIKIPYQKVRGQTSKHSQSSAQPYGFLRLIYPQESYLKKCYSVLIRNRSLCLLRLYSRIYTTRKTVVPYRTGQIKLIPQC